MVAGFIVIQENGLEKQTTGWNIKIKDDDVVVADPDDIMCTELYGCSETRIK